MGAATQVLIVEDDKDLSAMLEERLLREGFYVRKAFDGNSGYEAALKEAPSLILLDLILPGLRGMEVCRKLKADPKTANIPIIMLTANADDVDVILGLEIGADDYVTKPFNIRQLLARIRAVLRRTQQSFSSTKVMFEFGPLSLDSTALEVQLNGEMISVTKSEFDILFYLVSRHGQVVKRSELLSILSPNPTELVERNIDVHIGTLRKKLGSFGKAIVTIRKVGYRCTSQDRLSANA